MSGSIGGDTHARNRFGPYVRARTKPVNPNTPAQQAARASVTVLTERWSETLNQAQRDAWDLYGSNVAMTNRIGQTIHLTGFNHYIRSNATKIRLALAPVDDGPVDFTVPDTDPAFAITVSEATQNITATYNAALAWADEDGGLLHMFQGQPQNAQRTFFGGPWRLWTAVQGVNGAPPASPKVAPAVFAVSEGQRQWVYGRILREDGRLSSTFVAQVLVAA